MIAGATRGCGGRALASHLANEAGNEQVLVGASRGLVSDPADAQAQMRELEGLQAHARTARPIHHVHCDPPPGLDPAREAAVRARFWQHYEAEFGLERAPFFSRIHVHDGRTHEHRVYGLGRADGSVVDLSFDFARREKVSRITEYEAGLPWTLGAHNRAVIGALERDGRPEVAQAMRAVGLHEGMRPRAGLTPAERAQQERTQVGKAEVAVSVVAAWRAAADGECFRAGLAECGLRLMRGDKALVVLDATGNVHALGRMLTMAAKVAGTVRVAAREIAARLDGLALDQVPAAGRGRAREPGDPNAAAAVVRAVPDAALAPARDRADTVSEPAPAPAEAPQPTPIDTAPPPAPQAAPVPPSHAHATGGPHGPAADEPPSCPAVPRTADAATPVLAGGRSEGDVELALAQRGGALDRLRALGKRLDRQQWATTVPPEARERQERLAAALEASDRRADEILRQRPHAWPGALDPQEIAWEARQALRAAIEALQRDAAERHQVAAAAQSRVGVLDRMARVLGVETTAMRQARTAEAAAVSAQRRAAEAQQDYVRAARAADARIPAEIKQRRAEQERFDARPAVVAARREQHGNALVRQAIACGDEFQHLAAEDLVQARAEMLRRDREEERRQAAALRRQRQHEHERGDPATDPEPDGAAALAGGPGPR
jgi:hypothetical protein